MRRTGLRKKGESRLWRARGETVESGMQGSETAGRGDCGEARL